METGGGNGAVGTEAMGTGAVGKGAMGTRAEAITAGTGQYGECSIKGRSWHQLLGHVVGSVVNIAGV
jgi:hypothetical protein